MNMEIVTSYWYWSHFTHHWKLSVVAAKRKIYQRWRPQWQKRCIWFSKGCRYQHFEIAWPALAFPPSYLSSQELAQGKKWWKASQYLNASRPDKFMLLFRFDMNIENPASCAPNTGERGLMDHRACCHCNLSATWWRTKSPHHLPLLHRTDRHRFILTHLN